MSGNYGCVCAQPPEKNGVCGDAAAIKLVRREMNIIGFYVWLRIWLRLLSMVLLWRSFDSVIRITIFFLHACSRLMLITWHLFLLFIYCFQRRTHKVNNTAIPTHAHTSTTLRLCLPFFVWTCERNMEKEFGKRTCEISHAFVPRSRINRAPTSFRNAARNAFEPLLNWAIVLSGWCR